MLPGVDFSEMVLLIVLALVLLGPRDLPLMMRKLGRFTGRMRAMAFEFRQSFDEIGRQAELDELRREVRDLKRKTGLDDFQRDIEQDRVDMERDFSSALAASAAPAGETIHDPGAIPAATAAPDQPATVNPSPEGPAPPPEHEEAGGEAAGGAPAVPRSVSA